MRAPATTRIYAPERAGFQPGPAHARPGRGLARQSNAVVKPCHSNLVTTVAHTSGPRRERARKQRASPGLRLPPADRGRRPAGGSRTRRAWARGARPLAPPSTRAGSRRAARSPAAPAFRGSGGAPRLLPSRALQSESRVAVRVARCSPSRALRRVRVCLRPAPASAPALRCPAAENAVRLAVTARRQRAVTRERPLPLSGLSGRRGGVVAMAVGRSARARARASEGEKERERERGAWCGAEGGMEGERRERRGGGRGERERARERWGWRWRERERASEGGTGGGREEGREGEWSRH
jgi:hypothetical protein